MEKAGSLVKEGGIIIHKIKLIKPPATSWTGFSHSLIQLLLTGNPDAAKGSAATRMKCEWVCPLPAIAIISLSHLKAILRSCLGSFFPSCVHNLLLSHGTKPESEYQNPSSVFLQMILAAFTSTSDYLWWGKYCLGAMRHPQITAWWWPNRWTV